MTEQSSTSTPQAPIIVWFRDDLRLSDHPALHAAATSGAPVVCLYVLDDESKALKPPQARVMGGATRWWLAQSLRALDASLQAVGGRLVLRKGAAADVIAAVAREVNASHVFWNEITQAPHLAVANGVTEALADLDVGTQSFPGDLLAHPATIRAKETGASKENRGLRVFTPFWKRILAMGGPAKPLPAPKKLIPAQKLKSDKLTDWKLEPSKPDWAGGLRETWTPGEAAAQKRLKRFLKEIAGYGSDRDRPDREITSRLSPHLRFGEISPRQIWTAAQFAAAETPKLHGDIAKFMSEVGWREFCRHLLFDVPDLATRNLQSSFDEFPWKTDRKALHAWQRGLTGYPIVDAGMRELWHTGVMHNRVRMVVASFLVKHLLIDWREGEKWFWDTLVDADAGSNPANWQWVAGSGADAAPYFRVFNPILQGEKFDPDGVYVRRWIPELAELSTKQIHQPWTATPLELKSAGITLGKDYPSPIVDHKVGRERALKAYTTIRNS